VQSNFLVEACSVSRCALSSLIVVSRRCCSHNNV
jgi:hypothetical protein